MHVLRGKEAVMPKQPKDPKLGVEDGLQRLEELVEQLESGDLKLEDAMAVFEEGVKLSSGLSDHLSKMEKRIEVLMTEAGGAVTRRPFTGEIDAEDSDEE